MKHDLAAPIRDAGAAIAGAAFFTATLLAPQPTLAQAQPNVTWTVPNSVAACPAGDSVLAGVASRLRALVRYTNASGVPRVGVPPESIWITIQALPAPPRISRVNDEHPIPGPPTVTTTIATWYTARWRGAPVCARPAPATPLGPSERD